MAVKKNGFSDNSFIHPGARIEDNLRERGITHSDIAARTGMAPSQVNDAISGKKNISATFSRSLENSLGTPKSFWENLQTPYDVNVRNTKTKK